MDIYTKRRERKASWEGIEEAIQQRRLALREETERILSTQEHTSLYEQQVAALKAYDEQNARN